MPFNKQRATEELENGESITHTSWPESDFIFYDKEILLNQDGNVLDIDEALDRNAGWDIWTDNATVSTDKITLEKGMMIIGERPEKRHRFLSRAERREIRQLAKFYEMNQIARHLGVSVVEVEKVLKRRGRYAPKPEKIKSLQDLLKE